MCIKLFLFLYIQCAAQYCTLHLFQNTGMHLCWTHTWRYRSCFDITYQLSSCISEGKWWWVRILKIARRSFKVYRKSHWSYCHSNTDADMHNIWIFSFQTPYNQIWCDHVDISLSSAIRMDYNWARYRGSNKMANIVQDTSWNSFSCKSCYILIQTSLKFAPKDPIDNNLWPGW